MSDYRKEWLEKTIKTLSKKEMQGKVFLIRLPISSKMKSMEDTYCPNFNEMMHAIAKRNGVFFLDFSCKNEYEFNDLHHMTGKSARKFSEFLGDTLQKLDVFLSK
jgi:hypothetical protein